MAKTINVKMTFAAGQSKVDLKTTIMKNGNVVNPAGLTQAQLNFCAKIAANKARRLKNSVVGFTGSEITVELPSTLDSDEIENIVTEEVNSALAEVESDIELETEESDYIEEFTAEVKIDAELTNEEAIAAAEKETEAAEFKEGVAEEALTDVEENADILKAPSAAMSGNPQTTQNVESFSAKPKDVTGKVKPASPNAKPSLFASGDNTSNFKQEFFARQKAKV